MSIFCLRSRSEQFFFVHTNLFTLPTKKRIFGKTDKRIYHMNNMLCCLKPKGTENKNQDGTLPEGHLQMEKKPIKLVALSGNGKRFQPLVHISKCCWYCWPLFRRCIFFFPLESNWLLQWFGCFLSHVRTIWNARKFDICQLVLRTHSSNGTQSGIQMFDVICVDMASRAAH